MPIRRELIVDLVRHARSVANLTATYCNDPSDPLDASALGDVTRLRDRLAHIDYVACYASPYRRCVETARALVEPRAIVVQQDEALRELEHGPWDGLTAGEVSARFPEQLRIWNSAPHQLDVAGRETLAAVRRRALHWLHRVRCATRRGAVLAVSHQAVIRVLVAAHRGLPLSRVRGVAVPNLRVFRLRLPPLE